MSATYTTAHGNAGSLTCILKDTSWVRNLLSHNRNSWFLFFVGFFFFFEKSKDQK